MFLASFHWLYFLCYSNDSTVNSAFSCWFHKDSKNLINLPYIPHPFSSFSFFHSVCGLSTPHRPNTKSSNFLVQFLYRKTITDEEQFWSSQLVFTVFQIFWCPRDIVIQDQLATDRMCKPHLTESICSAHTYIWAGHHGNPSQIAGRNPGFALQLLWPILNLCNRKSDSHKMSLSSHIWMQNDTLTFRCQHLG